nr:MFS transporter [Clavibacter michiganensis]
MQVFGETGSALALSALTVVSTVASIYLAPFTGWAADRLGHRRAALASNAVLALSSGGMAVVSAIGPGRLLAVVYPLTLVSALAASTLALTLTASVRRMRREADLTRINGVTSLLQDGPTLLAPVLGAALSAVVAPAAVFVVDGVTSLGCVDALLVVRWDAPPDRRIANPFRGARDGIAWIIRHPGLRRLQLGFGALNLANGIAASATTAYVLLLGAGGIGSGASLAAFSIAGSAGLLAGAAFVAARGDRTPRLVAIAGSAVVLGLWAASRWARARSWRCGSSRPSSATSRSRCRARPSPRSGRSGSRPRARARCSAPRDSSGRASTRRPCSSAARSRWRCTRSVRRPRSGS